MHFLRCQLSVIHSFWLVGYRELRGCWSPSSSRICRRRWSASCGLEMRSRLADREHGLCEDELQVLCPWGEGDLEDDSEKWRLGALLWNGQLMAPGWSSWLPMRCRGSPGWWQGWLPSKPPSHASLERPTRGSDVAQVSVISEEDESAETAHDLQMNWTHGEHGNCQTVSAWREETGVQSGKRSQKTLGGVWPGADVCQQKTSRWIDCSDGRRPLLVLIRPYAEPVTPPGRQRDLAAAAGWGPCSRTK